MATAGSDSFNQLFSSSTLTIKYDPTPGVATRPTPMPSALATATGSSPGRFSLAPTATGLGTASPTSTSGRASGGMNKGVQNLLIAVGCVAAFVVILCTSYAVFRIRRGRRGKSSGFLGFVMPQPGNDGIYRQLQDLKTIDGSYRKESLATRSDTMTPTTYNSNSPPLNSTPVMTPPPLRLNTTFIGRERNALVRASLNRHQLSTLEEHSTYEYENESVYHPSPPQPSLAQQISSSARDVRTSPTPSSEDDSPEVNEIAIAEIRSPLTVAPLQPRKINIPPPPSTRSSWVTTLSQPQTPLTALNPPETPPFPMPSLPSDPNMMSGSRSVDHWADYQNRMAERDRSMTSGEYSQAFKDRESTADSLSDDQKRDSNSTIAVFRYHPGEEVQWCNNGGGDGGGGGGGGGGGSYAYTHTPPLPSSQPQQQPSSIPPPIPPQPSASTSTTYYEPYRPYQPYQPPKRMHSAKNARGPRYQWATSSNSESTQQQQQSSSSSSSSSNNTTTNSTTTGGPPHHHREESDATVFKYHPGREVIIDRTSKIKSEDLDAWFMRSSSR